MRCYEIICVFNINLFGSTNNPALNYGLQSQIYDWGLLCLYQVCEAVSHRELEIIVGIGLYLVIDSVKEPWLIYMIIEFHIIQLLYCYEVLLVWQTSISQLDILLCELIRTIIFIIFGHNLGYFGLFVLFNYGSQLNQQIKTSLINHISNELSYLFIAIDLGHVHIIEYEAVFDKVFEKIIYERAI